MQYHSTEYSDDQNSLRLAYYRTNLDININTCMHAQSACGGSNSEWGLNSVRTGMGEVLLAPDRACYVFPPYATWPRSILLFSWIKTIRWLLEEVDGSDEHIKPL